MNNDTLLKHDDLQLKVLVLAEFSPRNQGEKAVSPEARRIAVDKETFGEVMQQLAGKVSLDVPNRLSGQPKELAVIIPLTGIKSFHPEAIIEAVPELREMLQIRRIVIQLRDGGLSYDAFRTELGKFGKGAEILKKCETFTRPTLTRGDENVIPAQAGIQNAGIGLDSHFHGNDRHLGGSSGEKEGALDSLLEMVEIPGAGTKTSGISAEAASLLDHFISLMTSGTSSPGTPIDIGLPNQIIADLDSELSAQVNEILHHPEFRRLETVWRGLKFLVDRTDFREPIQIEVLSVPKEALARRFETHVFQPEYEGGNEAPVSVIIADYEFDRSLQDIGMLSELARKAEMLQSPFITAIGPMFLGLDSLRAYDRIPSLKSLFQQPEYMKWTSLRQGDRSRWLALLFNRFMLRNFYGPEHEQVRTFDFRESASGSADADYLWGNPVWGIASLLTLSFARTGWCSNITGVRGGGVIENLPVHEARTPGGQTAQIPLRVFISEQQEGDFAEAGIIALSCRLNSDATVMSSAPMVHLPEKYPDAMETSMSMLRATLPYQVFAGRLSQFVNRIAGAIGQVESPEAVERFFKDALTSLLSPFGRASADAVEVKVRESKGHPGRSEIIIIIQPDKAGIYGLPPIELSLLKK